LHLEEDIVYDLSRIQALKAWVSDGEVSSAAWEDRLSELAAYRKIHGHCNVPTETWKGPS
jgi:hypothetical protein